MYWNISITSITTFNYKGSIMKEVSTTVATLAKDQYMAIMNKTGEHLIAFVTPAKGVNVTHFIDAMADKGVNVVIQTKDSTERTIDL